MGILEEIWENGLYPGMDGVRHSEEYVNVAKDVIASEEKLFEVLNHERRNAYLKHMVNHRKMNMLAKGEAFAIGFRMGAKIGIEVLTDEFEDRADSNSSEKK